MLLAGELLCLYLSRAIVMCICVTCSCYAYFNGDLCVLFGVYEINISYKWMTQWLHWLSCWTNVVHKACDMYLEARLNFVNCYVHEMHDAHIPSILVLFCDLALFYLGRYANCYSSRYWFAENPALNHEVPLHDVMGGVLCAKCAAEIIVPVLFLRP